MFADLGQECERRIKYRQHSQTESSTRRENAWPIRLHYATRPRSSPASGSRPAPLAADFSRAREHLRQPVCLCRHDQLPAFLSPETPSLAIVGKLGCISKSFDSK